MVAVTYVYIVIVFKHAVKLILQGYHFLKKVAVLYNIPAVYFYYRVIICQCGLL